MIFRLDLRKKHSPASQLTDHIIFLCQQGMIEAPIPWETLKKRIQACPLTPQEETTLLHHLAQLGFVISNSKGWIIQPSMDTNAPYFFQGTSLMRYFIQLGHTVNVTTVEESMMSSSTFLPKTWEKGIPGYRVVQQYDDHLHFLALVDVTIALFPTTKHPKVVLPDESFIDAFLAKSGHAIHLVKRTIQSIPSSQLLNLAPSIPSTPLIKYGFQYYDMKGSMLASGAIYLTQLPQINATITIK